MANLKGIIQLRRFQLDEKRRSLGDLQRLATGVEDDLRRLDEGIEDEKKRAGVAEESPVAFAFGPYVQNALDRRKKLEESLLRLEAQIANATDQVREAFNELKTLEEAQTQREIIAAKRMARIETARLDDMGIDAFRRRLSEAG